MDGVAALLDGPRARRAFVLRSVLQPPWALRVEDEAALAVVAVVRGRAWVRGLTPEPVVADAGSVLLLRGPDPYELAGHPDTAPQAVIHPDETCTGLGGAPLTWRTGTGVRTWGNADREVVGPDSAVLLTGTYAEVGDLGRGLVLALPPLVVLPATASSSVLIDLLVQENARDQPGQEAVLDRLLDLLLVSTIRAWWDGSTGWFGAWSDPVVGRVLQLMQHEPERPWTLAALAARAGVSRAGLARRFTRLVGHSPMGFLTAWRLDMAADLLATSDETLEQIAHRVGYADAFGLSTAFRRERGRSPRAYRQAVRAERGAAVR